MTYVTYICSLQHDKDTTQASFTRWLVGLQHEKGTYTTGLYTRLPMWLTFVGLQQENGTPQASIPGELQLKYLLSCQSWYPDTPQQYNCNTEKVYDYKKKMYLGTLRPHGSKSPKQSCTKVPSLEQNKSW